LRVGGIGQHCGNGSVLPLRRCCTAVASVNDEKDKQRCSDQQDGRDPEKAAPWHLRHARLVRGGKSQAQRRSHLARRFHIRLNIGRCRANKRCFGLRQYLFGNEEVAKVAVDNGFTNEAPGIGRRCIDPRIKRGALLLRRDAIQMRGD